MKALWSRFLPAYVQATEMINNGTIGELEHVSVHHLLSGGANVKRLMNINLGGSITLDIGVYSIHAILTAVNFTKPTELKVVGKKLTDKAADHSVAGVMSFPGKVTASFVMTASTSRETNQRLSAAEYIGTKGYIRLPYPMNGPDSFEVNGRTVETKISDGQAGYIWPTSGGLRYQAEHMRQQIENGRLTSDQMSPELSQLFADLTADIYAQLNVTFPETITNYEFKQIE